MLRELHLWCSEPAESAGEPLITMCAHDINTYGTRAVNKKPGKPTDTKIKL